MQRRSSRRWARAHAIRTDTPAIVLQLGPNPVPYGALGVVRTLGRLGVAVVEALAPGCTPSDSRYVAEVVWLPADDGPEAVTAALMALARRLGHRPVLYATGDVGARFLDEHAAELRGALRIPASPSGLARQLSDKEQLGELCARLGVPTPRTIRPEDDAALESSLAALSYPVVVKSADPDVLAATPGQRSVVIANDADQVRALFPRAPWRSSNLLLQEYLAGDATSVWMFNGYVSADGRLLASYCGQKVRQHPIETGCTALGVCRDNAEVAELAGHFLLGIGYRGIVDMGFRLDARDGTYKLLDVNPRLGATFRLFVGDDGLDVVRAMYLDLTGQPHHAAPAREGRRWLVEPFDLSSSFRLIARRQLSLWRALGSWRGVREVAWWAPDDPMPAAWMWRRLARHVLGARRGARSEARLRASAVEPVVEATLAMPSEQVA